MISYTDFYWYCAMIKSLIYQILIEDLLSVRYRIPDGSDGKKSACNAGDPR